MSDQGEFNVYQFRMRLVEIPKCADCDTRGRDDDAWHLLYECLIFQLFHEDAIITLQEMGEEPLTPDSLAPIML